MPKTCRFLILLPLLMLLAAENGVFASSAAAVEITRSGRSINLDGFVVDWNDRTRHKWDGAESWYWDAINTPQGLAGYIHNPAARCTAWTLYADARHLAGAPLVMASLQGKVDHRFATSIEKKDSAGVFTLEWLIPWDSVAIDSTGAYTVHLAAVSSQGEKLPPFAITGNVRKLKSGIPLPPWFVPQLILIVGLLVVFVRLQFTIKKKRPRRGLPRRSA